MKQFSKILNFELNCYIKNKAFVGVTLLLVAVIAVVMFFPRFAGLFSKGDEADTEKERPVMLVYSEGVADGSVVKEIFSGIFEDHDVSVTSESLDNIKESILSGEAECAFVLTEDNKYTYYVNNLNINDTNSALATEALRAVCQMNAMTNAGMSAEEASAVMNIQIEGSIESLGKDQMENFFYTYIMIFALYMVIIMYGQMVAMSVATEKSSRAMELLITSAKPVNMMFAKVISSCIAGLSQLILIFGSAMVFYKLNEGYWGENMIIESIFNIPAELLFYMLVFFLLGFLIYAFLYGAIASTVSKLEDINTAVQPVTYIFIIGFFVVMFSMSGGSVDSVLMKVCSFVPFTSPMAMFTRIAMGTVMWYEIAISVAILAVSVVGIGYISAKIYRIGVLLYGNRPKLSSILKSIAKS